MVAVGVAYLLRVVILNDLLDLAVKHSLQLEHFFVYFSHINTFPAVKMLKISYNFEHFSVIVLAEEGHDRDAVREMEGERIDVVVHDQDVREGHWLENTKVLHKNALILHVDAVVTEVPVLH